MAGVLHAGCEAIDADENNDGSKEEGPEDEHGPRLRGGRLGRWVRDGMMKRELWRAHSLRWRERRGLWPAQENNAV